MATTSALGAELEREPWLSAYIIDEDFDLTAARRRHDAAQGRLRKTLADRGIAVRTTMTTKTGLATTAYNDDRELAP